MDALDLATLYRHCPACGATPLVPAPDGHMTACPACGFAAYSNAAAAVGVVAWNGAGELLVCERARDPGKGRLDLPGGFVDPGETAEEACARECREELGIELTGFRYLASYPNEYPYRRLNVRVLDLFFSVRIDAGQARSLRAGDDVAAAAFRSLDGLRAEDFAFPSTRRLLGEVLLRGRPDGQAGCS